MYKYCIHKYTMFHYYRLKRIILFNSSRMFYMFT